MNNRSIRLVVLLGTISIVGVLVVQVFWLRKAFDLRENQFNQNVTLALDNIVGALCEYNETDVPTENPVEQIAGNYFVVRTNNVIPPGVLESLLKTEFRKRVIQSDFEYTIHDCRSQQVVYKSYISLDSPEEVRSSIKATPEFDENEYYFGVFFPNKTASIVNQMGVWIFSTSVLLIVIIFFAVALMIIFRQKRMSEIQRDFVNNMAHEFNTPLSSIGLAVNYFRQQGEMQQIKKSDTYLGIIENENQKLQKQVSEILQLGRYEQQQIKLDLQPCEVGQALEEARENLQLNFPGHAIDLTLTGPLSTMVWADPYHLRNVFYNLLENIVKYCPENTRATLNVQPGRGHVLVTLADSGNGIPAKYRKRIFNRFFRVPSGDLQRVKGFGIGLFYVRFILKKMQAHIRLLKSGEDGSTFQLKFKAT